MTRTGLVLITLALFFLASCGKPDVNLANKAIVQDVPTPALSPTWPKDGNYNGKGKVTKVNPDMPSVELNHEEIVGLMPAMIMEFYVKDKSLLHGINVGDEVEFVIEYKHPSETIVEIKKTK